MQIRKCKEIPIYDFFESTALKVCQVSELSERGFCVPKKVGL